MKPQRVTPEQLERMAAKSGEPIEFHGDQAILRLHGGEYVADLPKTERAS